MNNLLFPKLPRNKNDGNIFVGSDIHGWHKNIALGSSNWSDKTGCRNFDDQYLMTDQIVDNINSTINPNDYFIHLGDWSFGGIENIERLRNKIKCKNIINVIGNHDQHLYNNTHLQQLFTWVGYYLEFSYEKFYFCCMHYPIESWNHMNKNSIHVHGHVHNTLKHKMSHRYDVSMEATNYFPVNIDDLISIAKTETYNKVDHH